MSEKASFMIHCDTKIMKVGNSMAIVLPKIIIDNYQLKQGDNLKLYLHELGLIIERPAKASDFTIVELIPQEEIIRSPIAP